MSQGMMSGLPQAPQVPSGPVTLHALAASLESIADSLQKLVGLLEEAKKEAGK